MPKAKSKKQTTPENEAVTPLRHIPDVLNIIGIDFSTDVIGIGHIEAYLEHGLVDYQPSLTQLLDVPNRFKKVPSASRPFHIGLWARQQLHDLQLASLAWQQNTIVAYELPFVGKNSGGALTLGFAGGQAMADITYVLALSKSLDRRLVLLSPNSLKKLGTAHNLDAPFTSGNGASEKHMIAQNVASQLAISDTELKRITTLKRARSEKTVYDATDALGLCWGTFLMFYALYHGMAVPKNAGKGIQTSMDVLRSEWEKAK